MKFKICFFGLLLILNFLVISCNKTTKLTVEEIIEIDLAEDEVLLLSSIADSISYVQLETSDDCLLGNITDIQYFNGIYYISDKSNTIYKFDSTGYFISRLFKFGKGPGEYVGIQAFAVDSIGNIHIMDMNKRKILEYNSAFEFIGETKFADYPRDFYIYGNSYVFYMPDKNNDIQRGIFELERNSGLYSKIIEIEANTEAPALLLHYISSPQNGKYSILDNVLNNIYRLEGNKLANTVHFQGKNIGLKSKDSFAIDFFEYNSLLFIYFVNTTQSASVKIVCHNKTTKDTHTYKGIANDIDSVHNGTLVKTSINNNCMMKIVQQNVNSGESELNPKLQIIHLKQRN